MAGRFRQTGIWMGGTHMRILDQGKIELKVIDKVQLHAGEYCPYSKIHEELGHVF